MSRAELLEGTAAGRPEEVLVVRRFGPWARLTHGVLMVAVFGLVFTGMPLKYAWAGWARPLMALWGGPRGAGLFHRGFAVAFFGSAAMHLIGLAVAAVRRRFPPVRGPDAILPRAEDVRHVVQYLRHVRGRGPRPRFGRYTYWEKFDYLAEAWGLLVIGLTGLVMWFPETSARFLPGWAVNAALIFHSYEALLAAAFLFAIHFFNTHLRPEVFPADPVIFTGRIPLDEVRERYPGWYERIVAGAEPIERARGPSCPLRFRVVCVAFVSLGIAMLLLVMSAALAEAVAALLEVL